MTHIWRSRDSTSMWLHWVRMGFLGLFGGPIKGSNFPRHFVLQLTLIYSLEFNKQGSWIINKLKTKSANLDFYLLD